MAVAVSLLTASNTLYASALLRTIQTVRRPPFSNAEKADQLIIDLIPEDRSRIAEIFVLKPSIGFLDHLQ